MKNGVKISLLLLIVVGFLFSTCRKYPEDASLSYQKPEKRLTGWWNLRSYQVNGFDSVNYPRFSFLINANPIAITDHGKDGMYIDPSWNPYSNGWNYKATFVHRKKSI